MPIDVLALLGAGGHASVIADAASLQGIGTLKVFSHNSAQQGQFLLTISIEWFGPETKLENFHVAIGDNAVRKLLQGELAAAGGLPVTVVHPQAIIAAAAEIGRGSFVAAGAIVAPRSRIGDGVIINHRAVVDHDVVVDDFSHIAPGAVLGGGVRIGGGVLVGAGATILPNVAIGDGAIIAAGAVVLADVPPQTTVVGVPARKKERDA